MNTNLFVNGLAVAAITAIAVVALLTIGVNAKEIALAGVSALGGFIGGVAATKAAP